jgi:hypothetical protein
MKKYCFLNVIALFCHLALMAQVDVGVKAGININSIKYKKADPEMASIGFHAGLLAKIHVTDGFFVRPEVQYSRKGYRFPAIGSDGQGNVRYHYVAVPILAGIPVGSKFSFLIGPEFGYLVKANSKFSTSTRDVTQNFERFDWGLDLGGAWQITSTLGLEVRYNYGFYGLVKGMITDQNGDYIGSALDGANRVIQAGLFYLL